MDFPDSSSSQVQENFQCQVVVKFYGCICYNRSGSMVVGVVVVMCRDGDDVLLMLVMMLSMMVVFVIVEK